MYSWFVGICVIIGNNKLVMRAWYEELVKSDKKWYTFLLSVYEAPHMKFLLWKYI